MYSQQLKQLENSILLGDALIGYKPPKPTIDEKLKWAQLAALQRQFAESDAHCDFRQRAERYHAFHRGETHFYY